ncbi:hypothetical protein LBMAG42_42920 [Deltaproteobacteria bacterium]|nr:hypothetical protein LBMAG42_42920 [Deltaproteobacteria bacterium]
MAHQLLLLRVPTAEAAVAAATVLRGCGLSELRAREVLAGGFEPPLLLFETEDLARLRDLASRATAAGLDIAAVIDDPTALERLQRWWARLKPAAEAVSPARPPSRPPAASGGAAAANAETLSAAAAAVGLRERWREMGLGPRIWLVGGGSILVLGCALGTVAYLYGDDLPDERLVHAQLPGTPSVAIENSPPTEGTPGKTLRIEVAAGSGPATGTHDVLAGGGGGGGGAALPPPTDGPPTTLEVDAGPAAAAQGTRSERAKNTEDGAPKPTVEREIAPRTSGDRPSFFAMLLGLGIGAGIGRKVGLAAARGSTTTRLRTGLTVLAVAALASIGLVTAAWVATGGGLGESTAAVAPGAQPVAATGDSSASNGTFKHFVEAHRTASTCSRELAPFAKLACQAREMKAAPVPGAGPAPVVAPSSGVATEPSADVEGPVATTPVPGDAATADASSANTGGGDAAAPAPNPAVAPGPEAVAEPPVAASPAGGGEAPPNEAGATKPGGENSAAAVPSTSGAGAPAAAPSDESPGGSGAPQAAQGAAAMAPSDPDQARRAGLGGLLGLLAGLVLSTFFHLFLRGARQ